MGGAIYLLVKLYFAQIKADRKTNSISFREYEKICKCIKSISTKATEAGKELLEMLSNNFKNYSE